MTFQTLRADGSVCCQTDRFENLCQKCQDAEIPPPPDPYKQGIEALRRANATPASTFAAKYAAERTAEFAEELEDQR